MDATTKTLSAFAALTVGLMGSAEAKSCRLDDITLRAEPAATAQGASQGREDYSVLRSASRLAGRPTAIRGQVLVELAGPSGRYVVQQDFTPGTMPAASADSWTSSEAPASLKWREHSRAKEGQLLTHGLGLNIFSGPLKGITLVGYCP